MGQAIFPLANRGRLRTIVGTDPAAGIEVTETVPAGARWRLVALKVTLVTDATVANRFPVLTIDDGTNVVLAVSVATAVTATQTATFSFADVGANAAPVITAGVVSFPKDFSLFGGYRIKTLTTGIVAGDNYGAPVYLVEEF